MGLDERVASFVHQGFAASGFNGGTAPFTWMVDGVPVVSGEQRRDAFWDRPGRGFARLSVIDAKGMTATARIRVE